MREILWESVEPVGMELCTVGRPGTRWEVTGDLVRSMQEGPAAVRYEIVTDLRWNTREVKVEEFFRGERRRLHLVAHEGNWRVDGRKASELKGCVDVDLEASPVTNTIAIRRTKLKIGESAVLTVAWVRFPSLRVTPFRQSYERTSQREYIYRSSTGFSAKLEVDEFGLVQSYGRFWKVLR